VAWQLPVEIGGIMMRNKRKYTNRSNNDTLGMQEPLVSGNDGTVHDQNNVDTLNLTELAPEVDKDEVLTTDGAETQTHMW
jgi:hypothetical protein